MKSNLVVIPQIILICVGLLVQGPESHQGKQERRERKFEYLVRRSISFVIGEREFKIDFTDDDLSNTPLWDPDKQSAPLAVTKAIELGRSYLGKYIAGSEMWELDKFQYEKIGNDRWVCILDFRSPSSAQGDSDVFTLVLKMDGRIIEPRVNLKKD